MRKFLLLLTFLGIIGASGFAQTWTTSAALEGNMPASWVCNFGGGGGVWGGDLWLSGTLPANVEFTFTGTQVRIVGIPVNSADFTNDGINSTVDISIDGILVEDNFTGWIKDYADTPGVLIYTSAVLTSGEHKIKVELNGNEIGINAFEYLGSALPEYTVTVSGDSPEWGETVDKLTDGILTNKWGITAATAWIQFAYSTPQIKNMYSLTSAPDGPNRDFKTWTVEGSNDGTTWTLLDTQTDHLAWATRSATLDFYFTNTTAFTYYKLNLAANQGDGYIQLAEIAFGNGEQVLPLTVTVSGDNPSWNETADKLIDGDINTKWSVDAPTAWIQFAYTEAKTWNQYALTSGPDDPTRDFKDWTLEGSNDETTWVLLDTQTGHASWVDRKGTLAFPFANVKSYKFFKFSITANNGNTGVTQLSEIAFSYEKTDALIFTTTGSCASYITWNNSTTLQSDSSYNLEKTTSAIVIDGEAEASWSEANTAVIKKIAHEKKLGDNLDLSLLPQTEADLYATYRALWTDLGVYMFIEVKDDMVRYQNPEYQWENDGVEFYFAKARGEGKIQIIIPAMVGTPNPSKPDAKTLETGSAVGSDAAYKVFGFDATNWDETLFNWAILKTATGYNVEVYMDKDIATNGNSDTNYGLGKMFAGDINVDESDDKQNTNVPALYVREGTLALLGNSNQEYANSNYYGYFKMVDIATGISNQHSKSSDFNAFYNASNKQIIVRGDAVASATLYNMTGQAVSSKYLDGRMSVENLKSGIYIISGKDANGNRIGVKKVSIY
jgi:hypothetical protein